MVAILFSVLIGRHASVFLKIGVEIISGGEVQLLTDGLDGILRFHQYFAGILDFLVRNVFGEGDACMLLENIAQIICGKVHISGNIFHG